MKATCFLSQDCGVSGPRATIDTTDQSAVNDAIEWAETQDGHPWDCILVNVYDDEGAAMSGCPVETYQIEFRDGAWECV